MDNPDFWVAIVDDEEAVRKGLSRLLRSAGIKAVCFASGQDLLDSLQYEKPDSLILDLHLPGLNGLDVLNVMAAKGFRIHTVVITGDDKNGMRERILAAGASAYLVKPLDDEILLKAIMPSK